jgi:DNA-directed RNA polymerase delta subunit
MSIRKKSIEELELMSYTDIAYEIIKEDKKQYNTPNLFKEICNLLDLHEKEFEEKIGDFYTALSTDKRFILIEGTNWDLKENHIVQIIVDEGEEDIEEEEEVSDEETEDIETEDIIDEDDYSEDSMDDEIEVDDGMNDLTIIEEEETEE